MEIDMPDAKESGIPQGSPFSLIDDAFVHLSIADPAVTGKVDTVKVKKLRNTSDSALLAYLAERRVSTEFLAIVDIYINAQVQNDQKALFNAVSRNQHHPLDIYVSGSPLEMYKHAIRNCKEVAIYKPGVIPWIFNERTKSGVKRDLEEDNRKAPQGRRYIRVPESNDAIPKLQDSLDDELAAYVVTNNIALEKVRIVDKQVLLFIDAMRLGRKVSKHHKVFIGYAMAANPVDVLKYALFGRQKSKGGNLQTEKATPTVDSANAQRQSMRDHSPSWLGSGDPHLHQKRRGDSWRPNQASRVNMSSRNLDREKSRRYQKIHHRQVQKQSRDMGLLSKPPGEKPAVTLEDSVATHLARPVVLAPQDSSTGHVFGKMPQPLSDHTTLALPMEPAVLPSGSIYRLAHGLSEPKRHVVQRKRQRAEKIDGTLGYVQSLQRKIHALSRPYMDTATEVQLAVLQLTARKLRQESEFAAGIVTTEAKGEGIRLRGKKATSRRVREVGDLAKSVAELSEKLDDKERKTEAEMDGLADGVQRL